MTAALRGGEWSAARPSRTLPPGKTRYPFYRRLGGPQGQSGRAEILVPTGNFFFAASKFMFRFYKMAYEYTQIQSVLQLITCGLLQTIFGHFRHHNQQSSQNKGL
jgi:hypothetical protein